MARLRSRVAELEDLKEKEVNALEDENTALRNKISELEDSKSNEIAMMQGQTSKRKSQAFHNDRALGHPCWRHRRVFRDLEKRGISAC